MGFYSTTFSKGTSIASLIEDGFIWRSDDAQGKVPGRQIQASSHSGFETVPFTIPEIDSVLPNGGLALHAIHELYATQRNVSKFSYALPAILARHRIKHFFEAHKNSWNEESPSFPYLFVWIGRACWPSPLFLNELFSFRTISSKNGTFSSFQQNYLHRCIFIDPPTDDLSLWALETALKSPAVGFIAAAARGISLATSRRLSLAARLGNSLCFLLRDYRERAGPTTAYSRWTLEPLQTQTPFPCWTLSLEKIKGTSPTIRSWRISFGNLIYDSGTGNDNNTISHQTSEMLSLHLLPDVGNRSNSTAVFEEKFLKRAAS